MIQEYHYPIVGSCLFSAVLFEQGIVIFPNYQGNALVNYTDAAIPFTCIISSTAISREYSNGWKDGMDPYYPSPRTNTTTQPRSSRKCLPCGDEPDLSFRLRYNFSGEK